MSHGEPLHYTDKLRNQLEALEEQLGREAIAEVQVNTHLGTVIVATGDMGSEPLPIVGKNADQALNVGRVDVLLAALHQQTGSDNPISLTVNSAQMDTDAYPHKGDIQHSSPGQIEVTPPGQFDGPGCVKALGEILGYCGKDAGIGQLADRFRDFIPEDGKRRIAEAQTASGSAAAGTPGRKSGVAVAPRTDGWDNPR